MWALPENSNDITDLMIAASRGDRAAAESILEAGHDVNARDAFGYSALMYAASAGHSALVEVLLAAGADSRAANRNGMTSLDLAAAKGHSGVVRALTHSRLILAARDGDVALVGELLDGGADVNARLADGWTALMVAALHNHLDLADFLLRMGADPRAKTVTGWTALSIAARKGYTEIARLITDFNDLLHDATPAVEEHGEADTSLLPPDMLS